MYWRLQTVADDFGRFNAESLSLLSSCFPLRVKSYRLGQVEKWFQGLVDVALVVTYQVNGDRLGYFTGWEQRKRANRSKFPTPPNRPEIESAPSSADIRCQPLAAAAEVRGTRYEDTTRIRGTRRGGQPPADDSDLEFEQFYKAYPRKVKKPDALKAWGQVAAARPPLAEVLAAVQNQRQSHQWRKERGEFIPYPGTWLRSHGWGDVLDPVRSQPESVEERDFLASLRRGGDS
jgi:hypothetical protein